MSDTFDTWAIVEIMGHKQLAGRVSEQVIAGHSFVRVDVPAVDDVSAFTKLLGPSSIYAITPVEKGVAMMFAQRLRERPIEVYQMPARQLTMGGTYDDDEDPGF